MTTHSNEYEPLPEGVADDIISDVAVELGNLFSLRDQYKAESDAARRLFDAADAMLDKANELEELGREYSVDHDKISFKMRQQEELWFKNIMSRPRTEKEVELYGDKFPAQVRLRVKAALLESPKYIGWGKKLDDLVQAALVLPGEIVSLRKEANRVEEDARAQALKAGKLLMELRALGE